MVSVFYHHLNSFIPFNPYVIQRRAAVEDPISPNAPASQAFCNSGRNTQSLGPITLLTHQEL